MDQTRQSLGLAAGALPVQEAGGLAGDFVGGVQHFKTGDIVAANPKLFKVLGACSGAHWSIRSRLTQLASVCRSLLSELDENQVTVRPAQRLLDRYKQVLSR